MGRFARLVWMVVGQEGAKGNRTPFFVGWIAVVGRSLRFLRPGSLDCGGVLLVLRVLLEGGTDSLLVLRGVSLKSHKLLWGGTNRRFVLEGVLLKCRGQNGRDCVFGF